MTFGCLLISISTANASQSNLNDTFSTDQREVVHVVGLGPDIHNDHELQTITSIRKFRNFSITNKKALSSKILSSNDNKMQKCTNNSGIGNYSSSSEHFYILDLLLDNRWKTKQKVHPNTLNIAILPPSSMPQNA